MSGNVLERTSDWYSPTYYASSPSVDPTGPAKGTLQAMRGGVWLDIGAGARASYRSGMTRTFVGSWVGFRVARAP
jgi:formylglycine-generating enzyme required for sulfatase activity